MSCGGALAERALVQLLPIISVPTTRGERNATSNLEGDLEVSSRYGTDEMYRRPASAYLRFYTSMEADY